MILNRLRAWTRTATPSDRADGASALARAYLYSELDETQRGDAVSVLTAFLDDPSPMVRRAMAEAFAGAAEAPHHIVLALAEDQSPIAAIVLARSPVLTDAEMIDCVAMADVFAQAAVASRPDISAPVAAALAETAGSDALQALAENRCASLPEFSLRRMVERHGEDADLREALLWRPDLPSSIRVDLVTATTRALGAFVLERSWLSHDRMQRVAHEAKDKAALLIAVTNRTTADCQDLIEHLRKSGQLSVAFLFRAILSGRVEVFSAALSELTGVSLMRVEGLTTQTGSTGFVALYRKAGLPLAFLPAFRIALRVASETEWATARGGLSLSVLQQVRKACEQINSGDLDELLVLMRRFEIEASRDEARALSTDSRAALALKERFEPAPLLLTDLDAEVYELRSANATGRSQSRPNPAFTVDLEALELELLAAA